MFSKLRQNIVLFVLLFVCSFVSLAQENMVYVSGTVLDSVTKEPLPFVSVYFKHTTNGVMTDDNGKFSLVSNSSNRTLVLSMVGYEDKVINIRKSVQTQYFKSIYLAPVSYSLNEIVVKPKKEKYSKKNNPAVDLVSEMIKNKYLADPSQKDYFSYEHYEKITYALDNFTPENNKSLNTKNFSFLFDYVDTSSISGKPMLVVSLKETLSDIYTKKSPKTKKTYVKALKQDGIDELLPQESLQVLYDEMLHDINIFDDKIILLTNQFVSPLSPIGPNYYKYFLLDTISVNGKDFVKLGFVPFNTESFGFTGVLNVSLDSIHFVQSAELNVPKNINLNFVNGLSLKQEFSLMPDGTRILNRDDLTIDFCVTSKSQSIIAHRLNMYKNHSFEKIDDSKFAPKENMILAVDAEDKDANYWMENRHDSIQGNEDRVKNIMSDLRSVPTFRYLEWFLKVMFNGYIPIVGDEAKFEYGPFNTTYSNNKLEGARFRVGGMTTAYLDRHWFFNGYTAFGCKDEKFKYKGEVEYSFSPKKKFPNEFPVHSVTATYIYDTDELGQHYMHTNKDNMFMSVKRLDDNRIAYQRKAEVSYKREHYNNLSYKLSLRHKTEYSSPLIQFEKQRLDYSIEPIDNFTVGEVEVFVRYAPNEKFYQARQNRFPVNLDYSTFTLSHTIAQKGFIGSEFSSNITEGSFKRRFWLSIFGYTDVLVKAGKQWNKVPYPLLLIPNSNMSYLIQPESYYMMNTMEFLFDQYASVDLTYNLNGFILNRIPLIKKLKFRELVSFRTIYGSLSDKNNPKKNDDTDLFLFPRGSYVMGDKPYMEFGVGLENILKILRLDYIWRLSYRGHENIDHSGIRFRVHVSF